MQRAFRRRCVNGKAATASSMCWDTPNLREYAGCTARTPPKMLYNWLQMALDLPSEEGTPTRGSLWIRTFRKLRSQALPATLWRDLPSSLLKDFPSDRGPSTHPLVERDPCARVHHRPGGIVHKGSFPTVEAATVMAVGSAADSEAAAAGLAVLDYSVAVGLVGKAVATATITSTGSVTVLAPGLEAGSVAGCH